VNHPRAGDLGYFNNFTSTRIGRNAMPERTWIRAFWRPSTAPIFFSSNQAAIEDWFHLSTGDIVFRSSFI